MIDGLRYLSGMFDLSVGISHILLLMSRRLPMSKREKAS